MKKQIYQWRLFDETDDAVERYCSHCGRKVVFRNSCKRRRNANGKWLYEYAIYKCEEDHTWNKLIQKYKADEFTVNIPSRDTGVIACSQEDIDLAQQVSLGTDVIEIRLEDVSGRWRLDKLLGNKIVNRSRAKICEMIKCGEILVDGMIVKHNLVLKEEQVITIYPGNIPEKNPGKQ